MRTVLNVRILQHSVKQATLILDAEKIFNNLNWPFFTLKFWKI